MSAQKNRELAAEVYRLFNQGELQAAAERAAEDIEVQLLPFGQTFNSREGFIDFMKSFKDAFPDFTITVANQVADEDYVVSETTWTGTHTGPLQAPTGEIPPTGKSVSGAQSCEVWSVRDGKVTRLVNYQDPASWLRQLGLVP